MSDQLYVEARVGDFGYYFPLLANSSEPYFWRDSSLEVLEGAHQRWQQDRDRKQFTGAATYFLDGARGSHTIKVGAEILRETQWNGFEQTVGGNVHHLYTNGRSTQVIFGFPTASGPVGSLEARKDLLMEAKLNVFGMFVNDTWSFGRTTINAGARYDRYRGWTPEQRQLAFSHGPAHLSIPDVSFAETEYYTWSSFAPRVGVIYDLTGGGRTVLKANYGLYWHNPGPGISAAANANQALKTATYSWNDLNGDRRWQAGEEVNLLASALAGAVSFDPGTTQPYTHEAAAWLEQQVTDTLGARVGFVYKTDDNLVGAYRPNRGIDAYTVPFPFTDLGSDGVAGTADDRQLTLLGMPAAQAANFPVNQVVMNTGQHGRFNTVEASINKRYGNRWSMALGGADTWRTAFPTGEFPNDPNAPGAEDETFWSLKMNGTYGAPLQCGHAPCPGSRPRCTSTRSANADGSSARGDTVNHCVRLLLVRSEARASHCVRRHPGCRYSSHLHP